MKYRIVSYCWFAIFTILKYGIFRGYYLEISTHQITDQSPFFQAFLNLNFYCVHKQLQFCIQILECFAPSQKRGLNHFQWKSVCFTRLTCLATHQSFSLQVQVVVMAALHIGYLSQNWCTYVRCDVYCSLGRVNSSTYSFLLDVNCTLNLNCLPQERQIPLVT